MGLELRPLSIVLRGQGPEMQILLHGGGLPLFTALQGVSSSTHLEFHSYSGVPCHLNIIPNDAFSAGLPQGHQWKLLSDLELLQGDGGAILCQALGKFWYMMPSFDSRLEKIKLPPLYQDAAQKGDSQVVFFGGTFNPWHQGHRACVELCSARRLIVVPDANPWKVKSEATKSWWKSFLTQRSSDSTCHFQTYRRLCLELKDLEHVSVYPGFMGLKAPNPTVDWLPLTRAYNRSMLMGDDTFLGLLKWKDVEVLLGALQALFVVPRKSTKEELQKNADKILKHKPKLEIHFLPEHSFQEISSTQLRERT